jgi:uncharacterized protein
MDTGTRNAIAELILDALKKPENAKYMDILEAYCSHVKKWNALIVPLTSLNHDFPITRKILEPLVDSELFKTFPLEMPLEEEDKPLPAKATLCLNPEIETDFSYLASRVHAGYRIVETLRKHPVSKGKNHIEDGVIKASLLFNNKLYFETHEILEEIWLEETGSIRPFLQGIIQIAVGFHHLLNNNYYGAVSLTKEGAAKLRSYEPVHCGLDVKSFLEGVDRCQERLAELNKETVSQFDYSIIPKMELVS